MSKRLLAVLAVVVALGLGTPALMADHGDKGHKHQHGNKHFDDDDRGWEHRDGYEYRTYGDGASSLLKTALVSIELNESHSINSGSICSFATASKLPSITM